ncbi:galactitol-specific phosphotransferase system IIC component [Bradyrhizobium elkanii]|uniref:DUF5676 family membrane protein n=1 Tax=Bradyrhizobium TaxID=374 RepID=UPI002711EC77|nr:DUF5676 family membrane protein [Bradyrhizobium elkanii]WLA36253.1 DUF5676 family membrane protein [Bradyrhizobium elkanii]
MLNTRHLIKVGMAWISIVYVVCFAAVAVYPQIRTLAMKYGLHVDIDLGTAVTTPLTFVTGLILWNLAAAATLGLLAFLFNRIRP